MNDPDLIGTDAAERFGCYVSQLREAGFAGGEKVLGTLRAIQDDEADGNVGREQHHYPSTEKLAV